MNGARYRLIADIVCDVAAQAVVWQWSDEFGVLCYDVCNNLGTTDAGEIFYAQPTAKMQREQSSMWMWLSDYERVLTVQLFLTMELVYLEKIDKVS